MFSKTKTSVIVEHIMHGPHYIILGSCSYLFLYKNYLKFEKKMKVFTFVVILSALINETKLFLSLIFATYN